MNIRKVKKSDLGELIKIKILESKDYRLMLGRLIKKPKEKEIRKDLEKMFKNKKEVLFVAEEKGIKGYIHLSIYKNYWNSGIFIEDLFVTKEQRNKGFASKLIKEAIKIKRERKLKEVSLNVSTKNKKAIKLYQKMGFNLTHHTMKKLK